MKQYKVRIWVGSSPTEVIVTAANSANALSIARRLYPNARVVNATSI